MVNRTAVHRSPRDRYAWMRNGLAGLLLVCLGMGAATWLCDWRIVPFNFVLMVTLLVGIPSIIELMRSRPTGVDDALNDAILKDFEKYFHNR